MDIYNTNTAYVIGVAIGDGNLSNSGGDAVRLRISCDNKYPKLIEKIAVALKEVFPQNKVSKYKRPGNCTDVYCYSNKLEGILGWRALEGSKFKQSVHVPDWILNDKEFVKTCLRGLFETDGSVYKDRVYTYVNFTSIIPALITDVNRMINILGYSCTTQKSMQKSNKMKYVIRVCKKSEQFIKEVGIAKE